MSDATVSVIVATPWGARWITATPSGIPFTVNWLVVVSGLLLMVVCIGRMNSLSPKEHKLGVRLHYLLTFVGAFAATGSPWFFPDYPQLGSLILLAAVLASTLMGSGDWRDGPPDTCHKEFKSTQPGLFHEAQRRSVVQYLEALRRGVRYRIALVAHLLRRDQ